MGLIFLLVRRVFMDRIKMSHKMDKTFEEGFEEYVLDMKARNLRQGKKPLSRCNKADL